MADYTYGTVAVYDPVTDAVVENAAGGVLVAVKDGTPIPIYDLNDAPITEITSNGNGQSSQFKADVLTGLVQFGDIVVTVWANEVGALALAAQDAEAAALVAQAEAAVAQAAAQSAAADAASAAAAAQAAATAAQQGGGLNTTTLDTYLGGSGSLLIDRMIMPWLRSNGGTGVWNARPDCLVAVAIGTGPQPSGMGVDDLFFEHS